jgi:hypothetical protein
MTALIGEKCRYTINLESLASSIKISVENNWLKRSWWRIFPVEFSTSQIIEESNAVKIDFPYSISFTDIFRYEEKTLRLPVHNPSINCSFTDLNVIELFGAEELVHEFSNVHKIITVKFLSHDVREKGLSWYESVEITSGNHYLWTFLLLNVRALLDLTFSRS